eukprot:6202912-Pleurochrysis_carterae.AAC.1
MNVLTMRVPPGYGCSSTVMAGGWSLSQAASSHVRSEPGGVVGGVGAGVGAGRGAATLSCGWRQSSFRMSRMRRLPFLAGGRGCRAARWSYHGQGCGKGPDSRRHNPWPPAHRHCLHTPRGCIRNCVGRADQSCCASGESIVEARSQQRKSVLLQGALNGEPELCNGVRLGVQSALSL